MKHYFAAIAILLLSTASTANKQITPSHFFQSSQHIVFEIEATGNTENIPLTARKPGIQINKRPLHVYSMSLEVIKKYGRYQSPIELTKLNRTILSKKK